MSKDKFEWNDELVLKFARFTNCESTTFQGRYADLEQFKQEQLNKQLLFTTEDGVEIFERETFYEVCIADGSASWSAIAESVLHKPPYDKYYKYFSTRQAAEEYILMNKPMLSVNDIKWWLEKYFDYPNGINVNDVKELAKQKLNMKT